MNIMQIHNVRLRSVAGDLLTANAHARTVEWLSLWTAEAKFKAVVSESREESLKTLRADLMDNLVPPWLSFGSKVTPDLFEFEVSDQDALNGRFWMPSVIVWCKWHKVKEG